MVFRMKTKRKTTPAASALVASRNFLMTQPPLLAVMQGEDYWLDSNLFARSMTAAQAEVSRTPISQKFPFIEVFRHLVE